MKGSTKTIRRMALGFTHGVTGKFTEDIGVKENKMD
jgi:hypothetical protein